jgi:hypothetical protein
MNPVIFHTKAIINTIIRLIPIGLYTGTLIFGILLSDPRAFVLLVGYIINDVLSLGFRTLFQTVDLVNCSVVQSDKNFYTLPSSHTQTVAFTLSFFFTEMYLKNKFSMVNFIFLGFLLLVTVWSRINIGCENIIDAIYATLIGVLIGTAYYRLTENWNMPSIKNDDNSAYSSNSEVDIYEV